MTATIKITNNIHLVIKKDTLHINNSGNITGVIFFDIDGFYFPEYDWDDFAVRILSWLMESLIQLDQKPGKSVDVPFMEGCFKVKFQLDKNQQCRIDFIEGEQLSGDKELIHKSIIVSLSKITSAVLKACTIIIQMKESKQLEFKNDYEELLDAYHSLTKRSLH